MPSPTFLTPEILSAIKTDREAGARMSTLLDTYGCSRGTMQKAFDILGITRLGKVGAPPSWTEDDLRTAVTSSTTLSEVLAKLKLRKTGGNFKNIRAAITRIGVDANHIGSFLEQSQAVGIRYGGQNRHTDETMDKLFRKDCLFTQSHRRYLVLFKPMICSECSSEPVWNGKPLTLQVDHIDGDNRNNERSNLRWLCPNCHSQTPTWGRKPRTSV